MKFFMLRRRKGRAPAKDTHVPGASLPRKSRALTLCSRIKWELLATVGALVSLLYIWLNSQSFHFHVAQLYAHLGYSGAQHIVGQRYLKGAGVVKDEERAMHWFRQASQQDHPHAAFNLAVGKLRNMTGAAEEGDIEMLLNVAARQGVREAQELLENVIWTKSKLLSTKGKRSFYKS